jgi:uncharacterized protein YyaL (SSP411 family)
LTFAIDASILEPMTENLLGRETSPYLLQHADNPVHWRPWGPEALQAASDQQKPILLSVGYAACHWCHVMAHESFEDQSTAALMNDLFINIKVDREERPDLDTIYQHALMLLGQQGGWPLTMFLTPEGEPFWGGTYFPPSNRFGRPGFPEVLEAISRFYNENPDKISEQVGQMRNALRGLAQARSGGDIPIELNDRAASRLAKEFDMVDGGIGGAPKFPNPSILELLWRAHKRNGGADTRAAVLLSLDKMSQGGIYDHLGGGYARYSTDTMWLVPHFEKMLYDNAQLMDLLVAAWCDTDKPLYATRVAETAEWVLREMIAEGGAFAATLDADSEGEEGKFYVWSMEEIDAALGDGSDLFKRVYNVMPLGNWEGKTILHRNHIGGEATEDEEAALGPCREKLLALRDKRIRPGWDDKVLVDWNGLMIAAMANAGAVFARTDWIDAAIRAYDFIAGTMRDGDRLWHVWRAGQLQHKATLDGYANMSRAALALYEVTGEGSYLETAERWIAVLDRHYWDSENGGYFFTADDSEALIIRTKSASDNATPAGNGVAAAVLARLYYLTGKEAYRERAEAVIAAFSGEASENLFPLATLLNASEMLQRATQIVIVGERGTSACDAMFRAAVTSPVPGRLITVWPPAAALPTGHPAAGKGQVDGAATAYVCIGPECSLPLTNVADLMERLS